MEFDLKIYSYQINKDKIGDVIKIYENIEEASLDTGVSRAKVSESINEAKVVTTSKIIKTTKEIVPGVSVTLDSKRIKFEYFFSGGVHFEDLENSFYKRVIRYENGERIYDENNLWRMVMEANDVYVSNTGYIKTAKGKINRGVKIGDCYYARLNGKKLNIKMESLVVKYFNTQPVGNKIEDLKQNKPMRVAKVTIKGHKLAGVYKSFSQAERETGINRQLLSEKCKIGHIIGEDLWFSEEYHPEIIKQCFAED